MNTKTKFNRFIFSSLCIVYSASSLAYTIALFKSKRNTNRKKSGRLFSSHPLASYLISFLFFHSPANIEFNCRHRYRYRCHHPLQLTFFFSIHVDSLTYIFSVIQLKKIPIFFSLLIHYISLLVYALIYSLRFLSFFVFLNVCFI